MLSVVDLFAGCGGISLGLEHSGFTPIYVNELNDDARATYLANRSRRHPHLVRGLSESSQTGDFCSSDIRRIVRRDHLEKMEERFRDEFGIHHGEIDLVVGGPPCQGFSGIGHRRSYAVEKSQLPSNHLYKDMAKVISHLRPKAFVFENVRGLLNGRWHADGTPGEIWRDVKTAFAGIGEYRLAAELVYAKHYGVPQNRPRVLLVGIRSDIAGPATGKSEIDSIDGTAITMGYLPAPLNKAAPTIPELLSDLVDTEYENGGATEVYPSAPESDVQRALRKSKDGRRVLEVGEPLTEHEYSKHRKSVRDKFIAMHAGKSVSSTKKFAQRVLPKNWTKKGPTITATSLPDDYVHYLQPRILTVREWARLQGFPDWYEFKGKRTTGGLRRAGNPQLGIHARELPKYTQIGNAVPVDMAKEIGRNLARFLARR